MLVRLLILVVALLVMSYMMHSYLGDCLLGNRKHAHASSPALVTQGLLRLGSGAYNYPRTTRSLRANTFALTAPPYVHGDDFLGHARLNTLHRSYREAFMDKHWNGSTMAVHSTPAPVNDSIANLDKARLGWFKGSKSPSLRSRRLRRPESTVFAEFLDPKLYEINSTSRARSNVIFRQILRRRLDAISLEKPIQTMGVQNVFDHTTEKDQGDHWFVRTGSDTIPASHRWLRDDWKWCH